MVIYAGGRSLATMAKTISAEEKKSSGELLEQPQGIFQLLDRLEEIAEKMMPPR
jgi:hypothetical protein